MGLWFLCISSSSKSHTYCEGIVLSFHSCGARYGTSSLWCFA